MKYRIKFAFIAATFAGGLIVLSLRFVQAASLPVSLAVPVQSLDLTDLDIRDVQNRSIHSAVARQRMETLFSSNLTDLLLNNITPARRAVLVLLSQVWRQAATWLSNFISEHASETSSWFRPSKEKKPVLAGDLRFFGYRARLGGTEAGLSRTSFAALVCSLLSSTQLLR